MSNFTPEPIPPSIPEELRKKHQSLSLCTDYKNKCGNCHETLQSDDKYCRRCGTRRGEGEFLPYKNVMARIYGPKPCERIHQCRKCSYTWTTVMMVDNLKYCPKCGEEAPVIRIGER